MIKIQLAIEPDNTEDEYFCYRVANHDLVIDRPLDVLHSFLRPCPSLIEENTRVYPHGAPDGKLLYRGPGWIGNEWRPVICWSIATGFQIEVAKIGTFEVNHQGTDIIVTKQEKGVGKELLVEALLGPALILALALHKVYCLHSSTVLYNNKAVLFLGESGKGKSTLARWLDMQASGSLQRIGDDILPLTQSDEGLYGLPHFPQMKLPADEQPSAGISEQVPLAAVYVLGRPEQDGTVHIRPLDAHQGTLALVGHTVASRLFDANLLSRQLDFCVRVAARIPVRDLRYPLEPAALAEVQEILFKDLETS